MRTLEQKISDAGPAQQRVDPHLLTVARRDSERDGDLVSTTRRGMSWYHLPDVDSEVLAARLDELGPIHDRTAAQAFTQRSGQALEIAIYRALAAQDSHFFGAFPDLYQHDDATLYSKEEPPRVLSGKALPGDMRLDFLLIHESAGAVGVEAKNVREWMYPDRREVVDLLRKCCAIDAVPVLIARRIAYSTFSLLHSTGVIIHQTFNQRYPTADAELAELASRKDLLGYHDIRVGNLPDARLTKFLHQDLPRLLPAARARFASYADLLCRYGTMTMDYAEFAWRVRKRERGEPEDEEPSVDWLPF
jgi:hypothetical protein